MDNQNISDIVSVLEGEKRQVEKMRDKYFELFNSVGELGITYPDGKKHFLAPNTIENATRTLYESQCEVYKIAADTLYAYLQKISPIKDTV